MPEQSLSRSNIYVRQRGRLTASQARALDEYAEAYLVEPGEQALDMAQLFGNRADVTLEIGFGVGQALFKMANENPEKNFVGIEVYLPGIGALIHQCHTHGLRNVWLIRGDARYILTHNFTANSLAQVNIFFPDPWPKRKHHKRRIIQQDLVELIQQRLVPDGKVYLATDWKDYASWMLDQFVREPGLKNMSPDGTYTDRFQERPLTRFEERGIRLGHKVWDLCFQKTSETR